MSPRAAFLVLAAALALPCAAVAAKPAKSPAKPEARGATAPSARVQPAPRSAGAKLKPGANGQLCLECHGDFEQRLAKAAVHTPVKARDCVACHNPHAADHGKMLAAEPSEICATCHPGVVLKAPRSAHKPVAEKHCTECHDPHASGFQFNL